MFRNRLIATILSRTWNRQFSTTPPTSAGYTTTTQTNGIRTILLNDPKTRNSLSLNMLNKLIDDIECDQHNNDLRVIVLSSATDGGVFSAGHNLKEFTADRAAHELIFSRASALMQAIVNSPVPVIARIDGLAAAAGCQLVATCDLVICTERSSFSTPGANFGVFCSTPGIAVARSVRPKKALKMLLTGWPMSAAEALAAGLVSTVVPSGDQLDEEVAATCEAIKHKSRAVIAMGKRFFYRQIGMDVWEAYGAGEKTMVDNIGSADGQEGVRSFIEKRKPTWTHAEIEVK